jgi:hypothetical protein
MTNRHIEAEIAQLTRRQSAIRASAEPPASPRRLQAAQAEYDDAYRALGVRAPPPERDESEPGYRGRLAAALQPHSQSLRSVDPYAIARAPAIERQLFDEVAAGLADRTRGNPDGSLRRVDTTEEGGHTITRWHGDPRTWMRMFSPPYQLAFSTSDLPPVRRWGGK